MQTRRIESRPERREEAGRAPVPRRDPPRAGTGAPATEHAVTLKPGSILSLGSDSYTVVAPFGTPSGESELFILERGGKRFVLKYYFPFVRPKQEVLSALSGIRHPYILSPVDFGMLSNRFFEVLPFAEGGSLAERLPIRDEESLSMVTGRVVDALSYCHARGILHRDIKPENLLLTGGGAWDVAVSDFGIASILREDRTRHLTSQAFTFGYAAPELFGFGGRVYVGKEADYYALGMTLIHLWEGRNPFEGLSAYAISNLTTSGNIRIPHDMPPLVSDLVRGLTLLDYRKRWGEKEVRDRLKGVLVPIEPKRTRGEQRPFLFDGGAGESFIATTPAEAAALMERFPEMGKKHLYRKTLAEWLFTVDPPLFQKITDLVTGEYPDDQSAGLAKAVLLLDPSRPFRTHGGVFCTTPEEIGAALDAEAGFYRDELADNPCSALFLFLEARGYGTAAEVFRSYFVTCSRDKAFNLLVLALAGEDVFRLGPLNFRDPADVNGAPGFVRDHLMELLYEDDSRFLVWLERRGILESSGGLLDPASREGLFEAFPWTRERFEGEGYTDPNAGDRFGYTPLHRAVIAGDCVKVRRLLRAGARPDCVQSSGWSPLHLAARYNRTDICRLLVERGSDPDAVNRNGDTPLHAACSAGSIEAAKCLLDLGVHADIRNADGLRPAALAVRAGNLDAARLVLSSGGEIGKKECLVLRKLSLPDYGEPVPEYLPNGEPRKVPSREETDRFLDGALEECSRKTLRKVLLLVIPVLMLAAAALAVLMRGSLRVVSSVFFVSLGVTFVRAYRNR